MEAVAISGTGLYTPPFTLTNEELVDSFNSYIEQHNKQNKDNQLQYSNAEFIYKASGIKSRYVMEKSGILDINIMRPIIPFRNDDDQSVQCEMALNAAKEAFVNAGITNKDIDTVIVACSNMERAYPAIAIEIQNALEIEGTAFDLNVACSSATFAIETGMNAILAGKSKGVLIINAEICTAHLNFKDRDSHFIFGDACTAIVLQKVSDCKSKNAYSIVDTKLKTKFSNNIRNNYGFLNPCNTNNIKPEELLFKQNGRKVFKDVVSWVSDHLTGQIQQLNLNSEQIKRLWLHQANINMNQLIAKKVLGKDPSPEESPTIIDEYANTSSAGSIICFHKFNQNIKKDEICLLSSFGAGYSVGSVVLQKL